MPASWEVVPGTLAEFYGNISLACSWNRVPTEGSASRRSSLQYTVRNYRFQDYKFKIYCYKNYNFQYYIFKTTIFITDILENSAKIFIRNDVYQCAKGGVETISGRFHGIRLRVILLYVLYSRVQQTDFSKKRPALYNRTNRESVGSGGEISPSCHQNGMNYLRYNTNIHIQ